MMKRFELFGVELFVFVFGRIAGVTIRIRPNSSKPVFSTALVITHADGSHVSIAIICICVCVILSVCLSAQ